MPNGRRRLSGAAELRRAAFLDLLQRLRQKRRASTAAGAGRVVAVATTRRAIASTFWGQSWCRNLERYSDYSNRLPRGRTYLRNGSVIDLQIEPGEVTARVSGSSLYTVRVQIQALPAPRWKALCEECAGSIDSLVELLQGRLSKGVMERICADKTGLFPAPAEIRFSCSCPDWASMCKHVAAVLYGVGARLDSQPELLFALRRVDKLDLVAHAGQDASPGRKGPMPGRVLEGDGLSELFGLELEAPARKRGRAAPAPRAPAGSKPKPRAKARKTR